MRVAGVDEAGRGPLAGPVYAAAVVLPDCHGLAVADSKRLSAVRREHLAVEIRAQALSWAVASVTAGEIDELGIHRASLLAMARALAGLSETPDLALIDGCFTPECDIDCRAVIRGDASEAPISAASILAKVDRDAYMCVLDAEYPQYGFARHKGYPTAAHKAALEAHGPCREHRRSFAPVRDCEAAS
ncbi:MAG: ribonuclease HII [Gammaproteobacteria bacterium]